MSRWEPQQPAPLESCAEVTVGCARLRVNRLLGEGSFGAVWSADLCDEADGEVAVKEIVCRSDAEFQRAAVERRLLEFVRASATEQPDFARRCPALVASEVHVLGPECWLVRLVMTRIAGEPLSKLLGASEGAHATALAPGLGHPGGSLAAASRCAVSMLRQLAPTLEHVSTRAYHRDITPRNILVEMDAHGECSWGLVDFGLAVDTSSWEADFASQDIGGDGLCWTTSAWYLFSHGSEELERSPDLLREYTSCLDMHSLGIAALRTFMELWAPGSHGTSGEELAKLLRLRDVWRNFWEDVNRFWQPIFEACTCGSPGALDALKASYANAGVHIIVSAGLCSIRAALVQLRSVATIPDVRQLCDALLVLIRPGKARIQLPTWSAAKTALVEAFPPEEPLEHECGFVRGISSASALMASDVYGDPWKGEVFFGNGVVEECTPPGTPSTQAGSIMEESMRSALSEYADFLPSSEPMMATVLPLVHVA